jgi:hypothetical protein
MTRDERIDSFVAEYEQLVEKYGVLIDYVPSINQDMVSVIGTSIEFRPKEFRTKGFDDFVKQKISRYLGLIRDNAKKLVEEVY